MKKWSEIKQAILDKLFLTKEEADSQGYTDKFQYLANECLNIIANGVRPPVKHISVSVMDLAKYDNKLTADDFEYDGTTNTITYHIDNAVYYVVPDENTIYYVEEGEQYIFKNNALIRVQPINGFVTMPKDFLSFVDTTNYLIDIKEPVADFKHFNVAQMCDYIVKRQRCNYMENPPIVYLDNIRISLPNWWGTYIIFYNALWHEIVREDIDSDAPLDIEYSILNCLPTYVASQLLHQDDVQRSARLSNEFEMMLARLDTNVMVQQNHYRSEGGWY